MFHSLYCEFFLINVVIKPYSTYIIKELPNVPSIRAPLSVLDVYGNSHRTKELNLKWQRHILSLFLETSAIPTTDDLKREIQFQRPYYNKPHIQLPFFNSLFMCAMDKKIVLLCSILAILNPVLKMIEEIET